MPLIEALPTSLKQHKAKVSIHYDTKDVESREVLTQALLMNNLDTWAAHRWSGTSSTCGTESTPPTTPHPWRFLGALGGLPRPDSLVGLAERERERVFTPFQPLMQVLPGHPQATLQVCDCLAVSVSWTLSTRPPFGLSGHVGCQG